MGSEFSVGIIENLFNVNVKHFRPATGHIVYCTVNKWLTCSEGVWHFIKYTHTN